MREQVEGKYSTEQGKGRRNEKKAGSKVMGEEVQRWSQGKETSAGSCTFLFFFFFPDVFDSIVAVSVGFCINEIVGTLINL